MVKVSQQELEKLEKDILVAQEKLSGINHAINRDNGIFEEKSQEIKDIHAQVENLKEIFSVLAFSAEEEKQVYEDQKSELKQEVELLKNDKKVINQGLVDVKGDIANLSISLKEGLVDVKVQVKAKENELLKNLEELKKEIKDKKDNILELTNEEIEAKSGALDAQKIISKLNTEIEGLVIKKVGLFDINKQIINRQAILDDVNSILGGKLMEKQALNEDIEVLTASQKYLADETSAQHKNLTNLNAEREELNTQKFQLAKDKDDLINKEEFIKHKYQEAGVQR